MHGALGRGVGGHLAHLEHPRGGADIDDGADAGLDHHRRDGLDGEELVADVHRLPVVPIVHVHVAPVVAVVVGGIVDEAVEAAAHLVRQLAYRALVALHVLDVVDAVDGRVRAAGELVADGLGGLRVQVHEGDASALSGEAAHGLSPDAARSAGDEHGPVLQGRVVGELARGGVWHGFPPRFRPRTCRSAGRLQAQIRVSGTLAPRSSLPKLNPTRRSACPLSPRFPPRARTTIPATSTR